jgi:hypothetical protein
MKDVYPVARSICDTAAFEVLDRSVESQVEESTGLWTRVSVTENLPERRE